MFKRRGVLVIEDGDFDKIMDIAIMNDALDVTEQFVKLLVVFSINQDRVISELHTFISKQIYNKFNIFSSTSFA